MQGLRIDAVINHFNENVKGADDKGMTQKSLAAIVMPNKSETTRCGYINNWKKGIKQGTFKSKHVGLICSATGTDANFLFGIEPMDQTKNEE